MYARQLSAAQATLLRTSARKYQTFLAAAVQKQQMDRDCKTLAFWRGDRYREEGSGEGIYPRNFGIFMTLANKSTKVGALVLQGWKGERRRVQKDTGKNKAGETAEIVLSLGFTMSK